MKYNPTDIERAQTENHKRECLERFRDSVRIMRLEFPLRRDAIDQIGKIKGREYQQKLEQELLRQWNTRK